MDVTNTIYDEISGPNIVSRVDSLLQYKCLSRKQLADYCGFSQPNIARWKTQGHIPDVRVGVKMADYLNVPLYWLITGHNERGEIPVEDFELLDGYHKLCEEDREVIDATMKALLKKYVRAGFEGHLSVD